jgi:predicted transcriptional regulator
MRKPGVARPTAAELEILQILWRSGPATVRAVNEALNRGREVGYTTTLKLMQIMVEKGLLDRDESARSHVYSPAVPEEETRGAILDRLVQSAFGGSAARLVLSALGGHSASREEIEEIRALLDRLEGEERDRS